MCGIAGYCFLSAPGDAPDLERMTRLLHHRGPDEEGYFRNERIGLGMRRLSIIDLETGKQPIHNETGDVTVVFNGEIYNFQQLRSQLQQLGHRFSTNGDTEVLVHGYEEWGDELPRHLRGMFTFAIWDHRQKRLLIGRDHFGIKPLFTARCGDLLLFASEIKSLLIWPGVSRELDPHSLDRFLSFLYIPEPSTIFRSVQALPAGHTLSCGDGAVDIQRYWSYRPEPGRYERREDAIEAVRETFEDSVRAMLIADVPIGLFLSGGVDSASILAMMARNSSEPVRTFSIGFGQAEHRWDELEAAAALAREFGSEHHEFRVDPELVGLLPEVIRHFDQPFANPTAVILHLLSEKTRQHVKVALSGTGGDELFAGYPRYLGMTLLNRYRYLPGPLRRMAAQLGRTVLRESSDGSQNARRARRFLESGTLPFDESYAAMLVTLEDARKRSLYTPEMLERLAAGDAAGDDTDCNTSAFVRQHLAASNGSSPPPIERLLATDIATYLPFNQLVYADRMSMAQSLEVRVPFVDQELAKVAAGIPLAWHLKGGVTKGLFREAMEPFLARRVVKGAKRGLNLPIALWFRGELLGWLREVLAPERLKQRGYFRPEAVEQLIAEHVAGRRDHSLFLWAMAVQELWHAQYLDAASP
ncbi:MAG: asparagine synthase (glutamine-hydrolyzing) [Acidobacteriota bacterium]